jgi:hypothetical protein
MILFYIMFVINIVLYKNILNIVCYEELLKLHIYLNKMEWYLDFTTCMTFRVGDYVFGHLRVLCYRIATLTYNPDMFNNYADNYFNNKPNPELICTDESLLFFENKHKKDFACRMQKLASAYKFIANFFNVLARGFRFMYIHVSDFCKYVPYSLLIVIFFYELHCKEFYY